MDSLNSQSIIAFKWSEELTKQFIRLRHERDSEFTGKRNASIVAWEKIIRELQLDDYITVDQAKKKWLNLLQKYKELKNPPPGTGVKTPITWPYYTVMDEVLGEQVIISPPLLISSSGEIEENSQYCTNDSTEEPNQECLSERSEGPFTFTWSEELTKKFIQLRHERASEFTGKRNAAIIAWEKIIKELKLEEYITVSQAKKKWLNLLKKYKELKNPPAGTLKTLITWPYYKILDEIFGEQFIVSTPLLISSNDETEENIVPDATQYCTNDATDEPIQESISERSEGPWPSKRRKVSDFNRILDAFEENNRKSDELITLIKEQGNQFLNLFERLLEKL